MIRPNKIPRFSLHNTSGQPTLSIELGTTERELFVMPDSVGAPGPEVSTFISTGPIPNLDVLVPVTRVGGGSDCGYSATVIGITNGRPKEWLKKQAFVNTQGGFYIGELGRNHGYGFAAWNFLWDSGAHYGPHRYEVTLYTFAANGGGVSRIQHLETEKEYDTPEAALKSLGLNYQNLLKLDHRFDC